MDERPQVDSHAALRRSIYGILICIGLGAMIGRILAVDSVDFRRVADGKFQRELADKRTELQGQGLAGLKLDYALLCEKTKLALQSGLWRPFLSANDRSRWCTVRALVEPAMRVPGAPYAIDKVIDRKNSPGWDTIDMVRCNDHFYSSKPPLLSTLMAAEYWAIYRATGMSLGTHPYEIGRFMLVTINGACLLLVFIFTARLVERLGKTDWGRILVMAVCVFGTFLTTFAITISNHLPAAACTAVLLDALVRIWLDGDRRTWTFLVAGFFSAMLVANELPALALCTVVTAIVLWLAPRKTLLAYLPPALLVAAAFFGTNWIAVQSLKPAYMHRSGDDNWYDYPNSYWNNRQGIDQGEKSAAVYSLHVLVGHHGIFSLTPVWCLSLLGGGIWLFRGDRRLKLCALMALGVTLVCMVFYIWWPTVDRNYGGNASAFRWVFWMAPMWLMLMLPATDLLSHRRWSRGLGLVLLALSALSASYPTWNAWSPPWIMNFLGYLGWL
ncbi:MAG: hypothetical protein ACLP9L_40230 [Thermoguttaceae bacterium]